MTSLASARGKPVSSSSFSTQSSITGASKYKINSLNPEGGTIDHKKSTSPLKNPDEEPFFRFYSNVTTIVSKTHAQTRDRAKFTNKYLQNKSKQSSPKMSDTIGSFKNPTDSYYVVPQHEPQDPSSSEIENLREALKATQQSLEAYTDMFERQKDGIKSSLAQLRSDLQMREQEKMRSMNEQIEELQAENDKLKIQMGRMKSRWDGLKESARKRRE